MPGTIILKPIQAHFAPGADSENSSQKPKPLEQLKAYCKFKVGRRSAQTELTNLDNLQAEWSQTVKIPTKKEDKEVKLTIKKEIKRRFDDKIGKVQIDLRSLIDGKKDMTQWFHIKDHGKKTGEILLHIEYVPEPENLKILDKEKK